MLNARVGTPHASPVSSQLREQSGHARTLAPAHALVSGPSMAMQFAQSALLTVRSIVWWTASSLAQPLVSLAHVLAPPLPPLSRAAAAALAAQQAAEAAAAGPLASSLSCPLAPVLVPSPPAVGVAGTIAPAEDVPPVIPSSPIELVAPATVVAVIPTAAAAGDAMDVDPAPAAPAPPLAPASPVALELAAALVKIAELQAQNLAASGMHATRGSGVSASRNPVLHGPHAPHLELSPPVAATRMHAGPLALLPAPIARAASPTRHHDAPDPALFYPGPASRADAKCMGKPGRLTTQELINMAKRPAAVRLYLDYLLDYCFATMPGIPIFTALRGYFADFAAVEWLATFASIHVNIPFDRAAFITAFQHWATGEVRPPAEIALEEILSGAIIQGNDAAATYAEKFHQRARLLLHESQASLCAHFLKGLKPSLRKLCSLDRDYNTWQSLRNLVACSFAEERKQAFLEPTLDTPVPATRYHRYTHSRPAHFSQRISGHKQPRDAAGPSGTAAAAMGSGEAAPSRPAKRPVPPERSLPIERCPLFGLISDVKGLTKEQRDIMGLWGLCFYCHKGRHNAEVCPCKQHKGSGGPGDDKGKGPAYGPGKA